MIDFCDGYGDAKLLFGGFLSYVDTNIAHATKQLKVKARTSPRSIRNTRERKSRDFLCSFRLGISVKTHVPVTTPARGSDFVEWDVRVFLFFFFTVSVYFSQIRHDETSNI